ncbi:hypothetical protein [Nereida sp. MMG025]|uniref:hypothetical protein n=1 Tax=Nereida sp. MMG025 TaxID=2909981 RepID=UPI001F40D50F|nr:hypothetical protein [Nereida sp. MMG025]MCF6443627.1 hypothetical protein [Nereida sp. MMG025]
MKFFPCLGLAALCLSACGPNPTWNGTGSQVGQLNGKALFQTDCVVDTSAVGGRAVFGENKGKPVPAYYACQPQARVTCGGDYTITQVIPGARRPQTSVIDNGFQRIRRQYIEQDMSIQYTCN